MSRTWQIYRKASVSVRLWCSSQSEMWEEEGTVSNNYYPCHPRWGDWWRAWRAEKGVTGAVFKGVTWLKESEAFNGHIISHQKEKDANRKCESVRTCEGIPALGIQLWEWGKSLPLLITNIVFINLMFAVYEALTSVPSKINSALVFAVVHVWPGIPLSFW